MRIICITGSRSEYGVMRQLLKKLDCNFQLSLIVTGMHLMGKFGLTAKEVEADGFAIAGRVNMHLEKGTNASMAKSIGYAIIVMTDVLEKAKPDLVIVAGDRGEMLAGAIAAAHLNIAVAHISGGDITTGAAIDERIRHSISKFSDIHFPSSTSAARALIRMGENPELVFAVGNPGIPVRYTITESRKRKIAVKYHLSLSRPILLVIQHPVSSQADDSGRQMLETLKAIGLLKMQAIIIYPNSDAGSGEIIDAITHNVPSFVQVHKTIPGDDFKDLMAMSSVIVGNSSCALLEAPSFGLPAVNIGTRQQGRERSNNIIDAPHDRLKIADAVKKALQPSFRKSIAPSPYAQANPEDKIISIIKETNIPQARHKKHDTQESS